jgi:glucose/arabinose dehydrogenase
MSCHFSVIFDFYNFDYFFFNYLKINMKLINIFHSRTLFITSIIVGLAACTFDPSRQASNAQETTAQQPSSNSDALRAGEANRQCTLVENNFGASGTVNVRVEEVVAGLEVPWGIAFLPNEEMLVTERAGRIRLVRNGELQPSSVATIDVSDSGEGGLLGIAAHPDFANNKLFYVY